MKLLFIFLFPILIFAKSEELTNLEILIETTKVKLKEEETLLKYLQGFEEAKKAFIENPDSAKEATKLVKSAMAFQDMLDKSSLKKQFSSSFLKEIDFYCKVGHASLQK